MIFSFISSIIKSFFSTWWVDTNIIKITAAKICQMIFTNCKIMTAWEAATSWLRVSENKIVSVVSIKFYELRNFVKTEHRSTGGIEFFQKLISVYLGQTLIKHFIKMVKITGSPILDIRFGNFQNRT